MTLHHILDACFVWLEISLRAQRPLGVALRLIALALVCPGCYAADVEGQTIPLDKSVQVIERHSGNAVTLWAQLTGCTEATVTLSVPSTNMTASCALPVTIDTKGQTTFNLVTLQPSQPKLPWAYKCHLDWQYGRREKINKCSMVFDLPYVDGPHTVSQGYLGRSSHYQGSRNEYAIDWSMPTGTTAVAAQAGTVVAIRQDSRVGGPDEKFIPADNYVVIRHVDGTFAEYCHLKPESVKVALGDKVKARQPLALSGNTGHSTGPHLHFAVFVNTGGKTRKTFPVKFRTAQGRVALVEGQAYAPK
jgi:hypothetical protein